MEEIADEAKIRARRRRHRRDFAIPEIVVEFGARKSV